MDDKYFYPEMGTGKQTYLNQVELEQLNKGTMKKGGKLVIQEVEGGAFWMPIVAELLGPVIKKVLGSGKCTEARLKKELKGAGFFGDLAKSLAKAVVPKLVQGATTALANKAADVAQQGTSSLLNTVEKKITGQGKKCKKGGKLQIGGCGDSAMPCSKAKRERRNALVKKIMKEQGLSLPKASAYIKEMKLCY